MGAAWRRACYFQGPPHFPERRCSHLGAPEAAPAICWWADGAPLLRELSYCDWCDLLTHLVMLHPACTSHGYSQELMPTQQDGRGGNDEISQARRCNACGFNGGASEHAACKAGTHGGQQMQQHPRRVRCCHCQPQGASAQAAVSAHPPSPGEILGQ